MEEEENLRTPFWQHSTDTFWRIDDRRRSLRRTSSLILYSTLALVFLLVFVFCLDFIVVPSFLSFVSQIFRPHLVKKTWDSLNLVLVLLAILFGFLSRNYSENPGVYGGHRSVSNVSDRSQNSNSSTPRQWKGLSDRTAYNGAISRLRSSSSYSDLLHRPSWDSSSGADERWRFSDDTYVANYQFSGSDQLLHRHHRQELGEADLDLGGKRAPLRNTPIVDRDAVPNFTPRSSSPPPFLPSRLSPLLSPPLKMKKKQRHKSAENFDTFFSPQPPPWTPLSPPSAPPSAFTVLQSMFSSKKGKSRKSRPPPEINPVIKASRSEALSMPVNSHELQFPANKIKEVEEQANSGGESPLFKIPKPPPLPPFKMPDWKFQVRGDFVRIKSSPTSPGTTSELEDSEGSPTTGETPSFEAVGKDGTKSPIFCQIPDVNSKADSFIARFRKELELEKTNSFEQKQGRRSNLGIERNADTEQE